MFPHNIFPTVNKTLILPSVPSSKNLSAGYGITRALKALLIGFHTHSSLSPKLSTMQFTKAFLHNLQPQDTNPPIHTELENLLMIPALEGLVISFGTHFLSHLIYPSKFSTMQFTEKKPLTISSPQSISAKYLSTTTRLGNLSQLVMV